MDFFELARSCYSVRSFKNLPIEEEKLQRILQAWDQGIGSCWVGYYNDDEVAEVLGLPAHIRVAALLPIGFPADSAEPAAMHFNTRELSDMVEEI